MDTYLTAEEMKFFDEAATRLQYTRRTFTEKEAMQHAWNAGKDPAINRDYAGRFIEAAPAFKEHKSHWQLKDHVLANNRLVNDLHSGVWDGRDLDAYLVRLDAENGQHHIFYPYDARLEQDRQGKWILAQEYNVALPESIKQELDSLQAQLLAGWQEAENAPWTLRHITDELRQLGWQSASHAFASRYVRAWLLLPASPITRANKDYWLPTGQVPDAVERKRLAVLPVREKQQQQEALDGRNQSQGSDSLDREGDIRVSISGPLTRQRASWDIYLSAAHLHTGILPVPKGARGLYPLPTPGENDVTLLKARWFNDDTLLWLWLDRQRHHFYGPDLLQLFEQTWLGAGDIIHVVWQTDTVVLQHTGLNEQVQEDEARHIDPQDLKKLRIGLGETYRSSLQTILLAHPEGLSFPQIVTALRNRVEHTPARGTIRSLLYNGGFIHKEKLWFAAPDETSSGRRLHQLLRDAVPADESSLQPTLHARLQAIHSRLAEINALLAPKRIL